MLRIYISAGSYYIGKAYLDKLYLQIFRNQIAIEFKEDLLNINRKKNFFEIINVNLKDLLN